MLQRVHIYSSVYIYSHVYIYSYVYIYFHFYIYFYIHKQWSLENKLIHNMLTALRANPPHQPILLEHFVKDIDYAKHFDTIH